MADIIVTTELEIPVSSEPGQSYYAKDTRNVYTADSNGKLYLNPFVHAIVSEKSSPRS